MARPYNKHVAPEVTPEVAPVVAPVVVPDKVRILSQRPGHIVVEGGQVIKFNQIVEVSVDVALLLESMYPMYIRIL